LSHNKERAEKVCLNCGANLHGRYCHACGQENLEPKESLWHLITHYFYDITHFDGKFFSSLKYLLLKPGFLPGEYLKGKRASYLHPIRMYVFTSAFFFIIIFSMFHLEDLSESKFYSVDSMKSIGLQAKALKNAKTKEDSATISNALSSLSDSNITVGGDAAKKNLVNFRVAETDFKTTAAYDSAQNSLPASKRDGWIARRMNRRNIEIWQKYKGDANAIVGAWIKKFTHTIPQLLFLSLPLFSFVLWVLYLRWRNRWFYTGHVIFSLYLYIFYFIAYLLFFGLQAIHDSTGWRIWWWLELALWIYMLYYMYKAMLNFYRQGKGKTFLKLVLLSVASLVIILLLFAAFTVFSVFTV
jgi:hypothetical protein